ncbi:MAG: ABC transporter permease [Mobilicoccus sp.]|nr:ABC transporter permease [Mobilicoccus sp.]
MTTTSRHEAVGADHPTGARRWATPITVALVLIGIAIYLQTASLDTIEARALSGDNLLQAFQRHMALTLTSTVIVLLIGIPLGVVLTRRWARPFAPIVLAFANAGQAIPSIGILVLLAILVDVGFRMALVALVAYALLPVLRNTMVGIGQVDPALMDAGRGMGMSSARLLRHVELPLAVPVIVAGVRVALILNVGVATLATYTNAGGLGDIIATGIALNRMPVLVVGSLLTICLALTVDWIAGQAETYLKPKGI